MRALTCTESWCKFSKVPTVFGETKTQGRVRTELEWGCNMQIQVVLRVTMRCPRTHEDREMCMRRIGRILRPLQQNRPDASQLSCGGYLLRVVVVSRQLPAGTGWEHFRKEWQARTKSKVPDACKDRLPCSEKDSGKPGSDAPEESPQLAFQLCWVTSPDALVQSLYLCTVTSRVGRNTVVRWLESFGLLRAKVFPEGSIFVLKRTDALNTTSASAVID